jgi:AraC-like DNA-binding protein
VIGRVERGYGAFRSGRRWHARPGSLQIARPGDTHCFTPLGGPIAIRVVSLPFDSPLPLERHLELGDPRGAGLGRVIDAIWSNASAFALEVALAELALDSLEGAPTQYGRPVTRALDLIRENIAAQLTLEHLATHAGVDKFRLCREFRARLGMSPYAYLTQLRVAQAKQLLTRGMTATQVAPAVGFYDQSQLTRHFRRLVGTTPGRFARAH